MVEIHVKASSRYRREFIEALEEAARDIIEDRVEEFKIRYEKNNI